MNKIDRNEYAYTLRLAGLAPTTVEQQNVDGNQLSIGALVTLSSRGIRQLTGNRDDDWTGSDYGVVVGMVGGTKYPWLVAWFNDLADDEPGAYAANSLRRASPPVKGVSLKARTIRRRYSKRGQRYAALAFAAKYLNVR